MSSPYIYYGGASLPPAPYTCNSTRFVAHVFTGDQAAQQAFIDSTLNTASTPGRYQALSPFVFVIAVACGQLGSAVPPFDTQGTAAETDISFWIGVQDTGADNAWLLQPAYMFVDNWLALAGGREIWGFPKALGTIVIPSGALQDGPITVSTLVIPAFGPAATASLQQAFSITPPTAGPLIAVPLAQPLAAHELHGQLQAAMADIVQGTQAMLDLVQQSLVSGGLSMVMLKQFRAADSETGTVYADVVNATATIDALNSLGLLGGGYQLTLADYASLPIARDLGLVAGVQQSIVGIAADLDFTLDLSS